MRSGAFGRPAAALILLALAACSGIQAAPRPPLADVNASLLQLESTYSAQSVANCLAYPLQVQTQCRDTIVQALMIAIDLRYEEFELGFFDANRYAGFAATLATLGLNSAGSVITGLSPLLNATAGGVTGAREAFKREVLVEQTAVALLTAMNARRDSVSVRIRQGLQRPATEYPLGVALADVSAYYRAGTIVGALTEVTTAVGLQHEQAQHELRLSILGHGFSTTPLSERLRAYLLDPNIAQGERNRRFREAITAAQAEGVPNPTIEAIVDNDQPGAEELRERIAKRMNLK